MIQVWNDKLDVMHTFLAQSSVGAEMGVFEGNSASIFLREVSPTKMHLIDPWCQQDEAVYTSWANHNNATQNARYDKVVRRFATQIACGQVVIHRGLSMDVACEIEDESLDWVSHDANHSRSAVLADLIAYAPKLRFDGFFLVDDYRPCDNENRYGVISGVADFLTKHSGFKLLGWSSGLGPTAVLQKG